MLSTTHWMVIRAVVVVGIQLGMVPVEAVAEEGGCGRSGSCGGRGRHG